MADGDLYAILGVDRGAEAEVIDAAYRALARKYHPDVNHGAGAEERIRALNDAYRTLHDPTLRARYDATLSLRDRPPPVIRPSSRWDERQIDLFGAALADLWRRARPVGRRRGRVVPGEAAQAPARRVSRRWLVPGVALGLGGLGGAALTGVVTGRSGRALRTYWSAAATGRAAVLEARPPLEALAAGGYAAAAGNPTFGSVATQLIAALEGAIAGLRAAGAIPREVEAYHFLQLDDWREERDLRFAQREAIQNRSQDAWNTTAERESAWRTSALHTRTDLAAAQLAALMARL
jgi:hypothetical protein